MLELRLKPVPVSELKLEQKLLPFWGNIFVFCFSYLLAHAHTLSWLYTHIHRHTHIMPDSAAYVLTCYRNLNRIYAV